MDLNAMNLTELKAAIYDQMVVAEQTQKNIQILNQTIASKVTINPENEKGES